MKSLQGKFPAARGWTLLLILFLGAGLLVAACGEDDAPTPTTPPPVMPPPEPEPDPPGVPPGLRVSASGENFIEWSWMAVEGVSGYDVQFSVNESFTDEDEIVARTAEQTSYRRDGLEPETNAYLRVRSAAGEGEDRLTSDWSTHVTGMTAAAAPVLPPAPTGLRVSATGSDFLEWVWDAVPGAAGYEVQFTTSATFTSDDQTAFTQATTYRVPNLASESAGALRVRAYIGSVTEPTFGDWSGGIQGVTAKAPEPEPLSAPGDLISTSQTEDTITLEWDSVSGAESYEVEYREADGPWRNASCDGGDNEVSDEECVVTDLDSGTEYEFRVRAIPDPDDDRSEPSAWTETSSPVPTEGFNNQQPSQPVDGGSGSLNVRWETEGNNVIFIWDRRGDSRYRWSLSTPSDVSDSPDPCENAGYGNLSAQTSLTNMGSEVMLFCVGTDDDDDADGSDVTNVSYVWATATPMGPERKSCDGSCDDEDGTTTAITWTGIRVISDFGYEIRLATNPAGDLEAACDGGSLEDSGDSDVTISGLTHTVDAGLSPRTSYTLCLRYLNATGMTEWAADTDFHLTNPARPPSPRFERTNRTATEEKITWSLAVRGRDDLPRDSGQYTYQVFYYPERSDQDDDATDLESTPSPSVEDCDDPTGANTAYAVVSGGKATTIDGIEISSNAIARPANDSAGEDLRAHVCVRGNHDQDSGRVGPWVLSSSHEVPRMDP